MSWYNVSRCLFLFFFTERIPYHDGLYVEFRGVCSYEQSLRQVAAFVSGLLGASVKSRDPRTTIPRPITIKPQTRVWQVVWRFEGELWVGLVWPGQGAQVPRAGHPATDHRHVERSCEHAGSGLATVPDCEPHYIANPAATAVWRRGEWCACARRWREHGCGDGARHRCFEWCAACGR